MKDFKGTKGGWLSREDNPPYITDENDKTIAQVYTMGIKEEEVKANINLIKYSPELLGMLQKALDTMRLNTQEEIDLWKEAKKLIKKVKQL